MPAKRRAPKPDQPEIFPSADGKFCWRVRNGQNKKITAIGGETFATRTNAMRAYKRHYGIQRDGSYVRPTHAAPIHVVD